MKSNTSNIIVHLDTIGAVAYLKEIGFPHNFQDEETISNAFDVCSKDYLSGKINTLLFCSVINKIFYIDVIKFQIKINSQSLYSLLNNLSELQYFDLIDNHKKIEDYSTELRQYLSTKNREQ